MKYAECCREGAAFLADDPDGELDARLLLELVCKTDLQTLLAFGDRIVTPEEYREYTALLKRRAQGEPLAYIAGEQEFMGLAFKVSNVVLIPNQDTENVVEEALKNIADGARILDMCTGSGCILLSLLHYSKNTTGIGCDISGEALKIASENAQLLGLAERSAFLCGDLFDALNTCRDNAKFDMIISNPPYIPTAVIGTLRPEVAEHEPMLALDGDEDGLSFYRRIIPEAKQYLKAGGTLIFEIGFDQAQSVSELMRESGYSAIEVYKDYGGNDRTVKAVLPER